MQNGSGAVLIVVGILILVVIATGKGACIQGAANCLTGSSMGGTRGNASAGVALPRLPSISGGTLT